jgi:hypothetical protein
MTKVDDWAWWFDLGPSRRLELIQKMRKLEEAASRTEIAPCGCEVMKGWRCPVCNAP